MTDPLPKWIMKKYSILWRTFKDEEFNHDQASEALHEEKMTSIILSDLKRAGWLDIKLHPRDSRKRIYSLKHPEQAILELEKRTKEK